MTAGNPKTPENEQTARQIHHARRKLTVPYPRRTKAQEFLQSPIKEIRRTAQVILLRFNEILTARLNPASKSKRADLRPSEDVFCKSLSRKSPLANNLKVFCEENYFCQLGMIVGFSAIFVLFAIVLACGNQILLTIAC
jgi:hypothetical protein